MILTRTAILASVAAAFLGQQIGVAQEMTTVARVASRRAGKNGPRSTYVRANEPHVFPQILDGNGWSTMFYLTNLESRPIHVECEFVAPDGAPLDLKLNIGTGKGMAGDLKPFGTLSVRTTGTDERLTGGWAFCWSDPAEDRFSGHVVVRSAAANQPVRDFAVPLLPDAEPRFVLPYVQPAQNQTGLVLVNTALEDGTVMKLSLYGETGEVLATRTESLKAGEQKLLVLNTAFADQPGMAAGSLLVEVIEGTSYVTGIAMRGGAGGLVAFTPFSEPPK